MTQLPRVTSFSLDVEEWYSCHTSDDEAHQAALEGNSVATFYTVPGAPSEPGSPRLGDADDALERLVPESVGDARLQHDHPEVEKGEAPAQKRTRNSEAGLPPVPPLMSTATPVIKARPPRHAGHRRGPQRSSCCSAAQMPGSSSGSNHGSRSQPVVESSLRVYLTVRPDGSYVHVNILPTVFCFGSVMLPARPPAISNDFLSMSLDQDRDRRKAEAGKEHKPGGFPSSSLLQRLFSPLRASSSGGGVMMDRPRPATVREIGLELLHAGKSAALVQLAAAAGSTMVAGYVQAAPEPIGPNPLANSINGAAAAAAMRSSAGSTAMASPSKPVPSPRDTAFVPPKLELPERDQAPSACVSADGLDTSVAAEEGDGVSTPPPRPSGSGGSSLQHSPDDKTGMAALALLVSLAADATADGDSDAGQESTVQEQQQPAASGSAPTNGAASPALRREFSTLSIQADIPFDLAVEEDGDLPTPTLEKCDSPVMSPTTAAAKQLAQAALSTSTAGAAVEASFAMDGSACSAAGADPWTADAAAAALSPGAATKKAYSTLSHLVKKLVPGFRDSAAASIMASSSLCATQQPRQAQSDSAPPVAAAGTLALDEASGANQPGSGAAAGDGLGDAPAGASAAAGSTAAARMPTAACAVAATNALSASPGAATRAAYGTVANLVKKMNPSFRDSATASLMANSLSPVPLQPRPAATDCVEAAQANAHAAACPAANAAGPPAPPPSTGATPTSVTFVIGATADDTASPRTASKAAYGTLSAMVKKMNPTFRDSHNISLMASCSPREHGPVSIQPTLGPSASAAGNSGIPTDDSPPVQAASLQLAAIPDFGSAAAESAGGAAAAPVAAASPRAAYGTVARLVKKMVPSFRDSTVAALMASCSPQRGEAGREADSAEAKGISSSGVQAQESQAAQPLHSSAVAWGIAEAPPSDGGVGMQPEAKQVHTSSGEEVAQEPGANEAPETPGGQRSPAMFIFGQQQPRSGRRAALKPRGPATPQHGDGAPTQADADGKKRKAGIADLPCAKLLSPHGKTGAGEEQRSVGPELQPPVGPVTATPVAVTPSPVTAAAPSSALLPQDGTPVAQQEAATVEPLAAAEPLAASSSAPSAGELRHPAPDDGVAAPKADKPPVAAKPDEVTALPLEGDSISESAKEQEPALEAAEAHGPQAVAPQRVAKQAKVIKAKKGGLFACFGCT